jgi:hypothetical protein
MKTATIGDVAGGERDCDGCTRWGARYHKLQQDLQQKLIELNDKRIAAEARVRARNEAALREGRALHGYERRRSSMRQLRGAGMNTTADHVAGDVVRIEMFEADLLDFIEKNPPSLRVTLARLVGHFRSSFPASVNVERTIDRALQKLRKKKLIDWRGSRGWRSK